MKHKFSVGDLVIDKFMNSRKIIVQIVEVGEDYYRYRYISPTVEGKVLTSVYKTRKGYQGVSNFDHCNEMYFNHKQFEEGI